MVVHFWMRWVPEYRGEAYRTAFLNSLCEIPQILAGETGSFGSTQRAWEGVSKVPNIPRPAYYALRAIQVWYWRHPTLEHDHEPRYAWWREREAVENATRAGMDIMEWIRRVKCALPIRDPETATIYR